MEQFPDGGFFKGKNFVFDHRYALYNSLYFVHPTSIQKEFVSLQFICLYSYFCGVCNLESILGEMTLIMVILYDYDHFLPVFLLGA